jgi:hypothetical protein
MHFAHFEGDSESLKFTDGDFAGIWGVRWGGQQDRA